MLWEKIKENFKEKKLKKILLKIEKIISEDTFSSQNNKLKKILLENYDLEGIGDKEYLWDILRYPSLKTEYRIIDPFNINLIEINSTAACNYFNGINCSTPYIRKLLKNIKYKDSENLEIKRLEIDIQTIEKYVEETKMLIYFLKKEKSKFSENINNKIKEIESIENQEKILEKLNRNELQEIIEVFKNHTDTGIPSIFQDNNRIRISLLPYSNEIRWDNSGDTHHFMLLNYIYKKIGDSFEFKIDRSSKKFCIEFLKKITIKKLFEDNSIFILPNNEEISNSLKIFDADVIRHLEIKVRYSYKLYNLEDDIKICFLLVIIPNNNVNKKIEEIFRQKEIFDIEKYYQKYLDIQDKNLEYYLKKNMITEEFKEKIENLD